MIPIIYRQTILSYPILLFRQYPNTLLDYPIFQFNMIEFFISRMPSNIASIINPSHPILYYVIVNRLQYLICINNKWRNQIGKDSRSHSIGNPIHIIFHPPLFHYLSEDERISTAPNNIQRAKQSDNKANTHNSNSFDLPAVRGKTMTRFKFTNFQIGQKNEEIIK